MRKTRWLPFLTVLALAALPAVAVDAGSPIHEPGADGVTAPRVRSHTQVSPIYPLEALPHGLDATVLVAVLVEADGTVSESAALHSDTPGYGFEQAAEAAVLDWRYKPARKNGRRVASYSTIRFHFQAPPETLRRDAELGHAQLATTSHLRGRGGTVGQAALLSLPGASSNSSAGGFGTLAAGRPTLVSAVQAFRASEITPGIHDRRGLDLSGVTVVGLPRVKEPAPAGNALAAQGRR